MCLDPASLALAAKGVQAATGLVGFVQSQRAARDARISGEQRAKAEVNQGIIDQEQRVKDRKFREGGEVNSIAASGVSGAYGSPFLLALENAETEAINSTNAGKSAGQRANLQRIQGQNQANQYAAQGIRQLGGAIGTGYGAISQYRKNRSNARFVMGGHTLPGVS